MCSANLLYALKSDGESLGSSAGDCSPVCVCDVVSIEVMIGSFASEERQFARGRYLIVVNGVKETLVDLRIVLANQRIMNMLRVWNKRRKERLRIKVRNRMSRKELLPPRTGL